MADNVAPADVAKTAAAEKTPNGAEAADTGEEGANGHADSM